MRTLKLFGLILKKTLLLGLGILTVGIGFTWIFLGIISPVLLAIIIILMRAHQ